MEELLALPLLCFACCYFITKKLAIFLRKRNIVGIDIHKEDKPKIAEMGGIAVLLTLIPSFLILYIYFNNSSILVCMLAYLITSLFGALDYFHTFKPAQKILILFLIGLLISAFLNFDIFGAMIFSIIFMVSCNLTNMLAGFNGLEVGNGLIIFIFLSILLFIKNFTVFAILALIYASTLLAFLFHNKYPAKVFPGDVATLPIGALFVTIVFICKIPLALLFLAPQAFDAFLKFISAGIIYREKGKPTVLKNGILYPPKGEWLSLPRLLLHLRPTTEPKLVLEIWIIQIITCLIATLIII